MTTTYEWDVEEQTAEDSDENEAGEVLDHLFCTSYAEAKRQAARPASEGCKFVIVLVRDADDGRSWAYMEDGKLPTHFCDAYQSPVAKVPQRFHKEVAASLPL